MAHKIGPATIAFNVQNQINLLLDGLPWSIVLMRVDMLHFHIIFRERLIG